MDKETILKLAKDAGLFTHKEVQPEIEAFAKLVAAHERNKLAAWMIQFGFATGHGDTMEQLCDALGTEIVDRIDGEVEVERDAVAAMVKPLDESLADEILARGNT